MDAVIQNHISASAPAHILPTSPLDAAPSCATTTTSSMPQPQKAPTSSSSSSATPAAPTPTHRSNPTLALAQAASPPRPHRSNPTLADADRTVGSSLSPASSRDSDASSLGRVITREDVLDDDDDEEGGMPLTRKITREDVFNDEQERTSGGVEADEEGALGEEVLAGICGRYGGIGGRTTHDF